MGSAGLPCAFLYTPMSRFARKRCGLECGASGAKLVLLSGPRDSLTIDDVVIEEESFEARALHQDREPVEVVRDLLLRVNLSGRRANVTIAGAAGTCFFLLPRLRRRDMEGAIRLQTRKLLNWDGPESVLSHFHSHYLKERIGVIATLARWDRMSAWCRLIERSGAVLDDVTIPLCAYQALARQQSWARQHAVFLLADIGARTVTLAVFDRYRPRFFRMLSLGGDDITKAMTVEVSTEQGPLRLSGPDAEHWKVTGELSADRVQERGRVPPVQGPPAGHPAPVFGSSPESGASETQKKLDMLARSVEERIATEIARSIQFYRDSTGQSVAAVYLIGGSSQREALRNQIAAAVPLSVFIPNLFDGLEFRDPDVEAKVRQQGPRLAVALGLALAEEPEISLLPRPLRLSKQFAQFAAAVVFLLLIAGFLPLIAVGTATRIRGQRLALEVEQARQQLADLNAVQQQLSALQSQLDATRRDRDAMRRLMARDPLWTGILNSLALSVPPEVVLTRVHSDLASRPGALHIQGRVGAGGRAFDTAFAEFVAALSGSPFFSRVSIVNAEALPEAGTLGTFELQCDLQY